MSVKLKVLIYTAVGLAGAFAVMLVGGIFSAGSTKDVLRIVCDGFFVAGALLLLSGGFRWCYNGGVMDGLGFSAKTLVNRMRPHYEENRQSFAEYREQREKKASSPVPLVFSGLNLLVIAVIIFLVYSNIA